MADNKEKEENEETLFFDPELFVDKDYKEMTYEIDDFVQPVYALNAASTDYDLTGQIVWPVSVFLSWFVARNRDLFAGKHVMELGAGCGLPGVVAARFAEKAILTDGNEIVLELLAQTKQKLGLENIVAKQLLWGDREQLEVLLEAEGAPDVIIGADVICWPNFIAPLLWTLRVMMTRKPGARCFVGYVCRATTTTTVLHEQAARFGLLIKELDASFLPDPEPDNVKSVLKLELLEIEVDPNSTSSSEIDALDQAIGGGDEGKPRWWDANTPC